MSQIFIRLMIQVITCSCIILLGSHVLLGCDTDESVVESESSTTEEDSMMDDHWWETDGNDLQDQQEMESDEYGKDEYGKDEYGKDEYGKDEADSKESKASMKVEGIVDISSNTGRLTFTYNDGKNTLCTLVYSLENAMTLDTCTICSTAWSFEIILNTLEDETEMMQCAILHEQMKQNPVVYYAHEDRLLADYNGLSYYKLHSSKDGQEWKEVGYSIFSESMWEFGTK